MSQSKRPSQRQLAFLKSLVRRTGTTFAYPATSGQASREIQRLLTLERERALPESSSETLAPVYATAPAQGEVVGYGAEASWYRREASAPTDGQLSLIARLERQMRVSVDPPQSFEEAGETIDRLIARRRSAREQRAASAKSQEAADEPSGHRTAPAPDDGRTARPEPTRRISSFACERTERRREIVAVALDGGETLLIDRIEGSGEDPRLLARLSAQEPPENAELLSRMYLADELRRPCRLVEPSDFAPSKRPSIAAAGEPPEQCAELCDEQGQRYAIRAVGQGAAQREGRWVCCAQAGGDLTPLSVRDVVGRLERYEPVRSMTQAAIAAHAPSSNLVARLAAELEELLSSPVVLNRGLREAVARARQRGETLSAIARRCGRFSDGPGGEPKGDASWVLRKIGERPERTDQDPSPWVHSDTLALIARHGLSCDPHEVEVQ